MEYVNNTACAITGHRPKSFPWKYDEADPRCVLLKEVLAAQISELVNSGVMDWFSGMALGVDVWSSEIILSLRKKPCVEAPLCPAMRGAGNQVENPRAGTVSLHFASS